MDYATTHGVANEHDLTAILIISLLNKCLKAVEIGALVRVIVVVILLSETVRSETPIIRSGEDVLVGLPAVLIEPVLHVVEDRDGLR